MIGLKIQGRLGNQLFQYSMAYTIAKQLKTSFFFDQSLEKFYLHQYFNIPNYRFAILDQLVFSIKGFKNIFTYYARKNFYRLINNFFVNNNVNEESLEITSTRLNLQNNTLYTGYFQSENYFQPYKNKLLACLKVKKEFINLYHQKYDESFKTKKIIAVHFRRGDYENLPQWSLGEADLRLPLKYYKETIKNYENDPSVFFVFLGDDHKYMEENFDYIKNKIVSKENEIIDFLHLVYADVCIISNSTFSWWGAYLNQKKNHMVICPKYFLGFHIKQDFPKNIYPKNWFQKDFTL
jgi:hypothetical protein